MPLSCRVILVCDTHLHGFANLGNVISDKARGSDCIDDPANAYSFRPFLVLSERLHHRGERSAPTCWSERRCRSTISETSGRLESARTFLSETGSGAGDSDLFGYRLAAWFGVHEQRLRRMSECHFADDKCSWRKISFTLKITRSWD